MSLRIRKTVGAVVFFLLVVLVISWLQNLVTPKYDWPEYNRRSLKSIASVFNEPKNSLDVIYLGTSQTFCSISPMDIYDESHIRSYNMASIGQRIPVAYYMLKSILRQQSPKLVLIDASGFFYTKDELGIAGRWEEMIDSLPLSCYREKLEMIREIAQRQGREDDWEYILSALIPMLRYHSDYRVIRDNYFEYYMNDLYQRKGYVATYRYIPVDETEIRTAQAMLDESDTFADDDGSKDMLADCIAANEPYLEKMQQLCREHGAELAFMKVPVCANTRARGYWSANKHEMSQAVADRLGVKFYDMCYEDLGLDWLKDSYDGGVHVNHRGAKKVCERLTAWMQETFGVASDENAKLDAQWDYQSALFAEEMDYVNFELEYDVIRFLDRVRQSDYVLFTTVSNGLGDCWSDAAQEAFQAATGTTLDLRDGDNAAYIGVSCRGELIEERHDGKSCSISSTLADGLQYETVSKTGKGDKNGAITIWGTDYAAQGKGIHFVVYDPKLGCVIHSVRVDTTSESLEMEQETRYQNIMREKLIGFVHKRMRKM